MSKKGQILLRNIFISILMLGMGFLAIYTFYSDIVSDYEQIYNITTYSEMDKTSRKINETFYDTRNSSSLIAKSLREQSGTQETGESSSILNNFFAALDFLKNIFGLPIDMFTQISTSLGIPNIWRIGLIAILIITVTILIMAGILKATQW